MQTDAFTDFSMSEWLQKRTSGACIREGPRDLPPDAGGTCGLMWGHGPRLPRPAPYRTRRCSEARRLCWHVDPSGLGRHVQQEGDSSGFRS